MTVVQAFPPLEIRRAPGWESHGHGAPVVLLHSSMASRSQWRLLSQELARDFRVVAIDLHGYGESPLPRTDGLFSLDREVELVHRALRQAGLAGESYHLVGHSYGGAVALKAALDAPQRVRSLALYEPTAFHVLPQEHPALLEIANVAAACHSGARAGDGREAAAAFVDYWNQPGSFAALEEGQQARLAGKLAKVVMDFEALIGAPLSLEDYADLLVPTCLIAGSRSPASSRAVAELLARTLPCVDFYRIGAGHMAPITQPELVNPLIARFLAEAEAYPAPWRTRPADARWEPRRSRKAV